MKGKGHHGDLLCLLLEWSSNLEEKKIAAGMQKLLKVSSVRARPNLCVRLWRNCPEFTFQLIIENLNVR